MKEISSRGEGEDQKGKGMITEKSSEISSGEKGKDQKEKGMMRKKSSKEEDRKEKGFCCLPSDLLTNIFTRLQAKTISVSKSICKSTRNLLSQPNFVRYHTKNNPYTTLVLSHVDPVDKLEELSFLEISDGGFCTRTVIKPRKIPIKPPKTPSRLKPNRNQILPIEGCSGLPDFPQRIPSLSIKGSCNGLLCLLVRNARVDLEEVYIYNPVSMMKIERLKHRYGIDDEGVVVYQLGFSPVSKHFKVLKFVPMRKMDGEKIKRCEIVTVGVDRGWRKLRYPFDLEFPVIMIALDRVVCWIARNPDSTLYISTFDFGNESFGNISHPPGLLLDDKKMELAVLNNSLCLIDYSISSQYSLWTMEAFGVVESWVKTVVYITSTENFPRLRPVALSKNRNIIFTTPTGGLTSYSPKDEKCTLVEGLDVVGFVPYIKQFSPFSLLPNAIPS